MPKRKNPDKIVPVVSRVSVEISDALQAEVDAGRAQDKGEALRLVLKRWYAGLQVN